MPAKIVRGDQVIVLSGRDRGRKGEVTRVIRHKRKYRDQGDANAFGLKVYVQGINRVRRHTRPTRDAEGGIFDKELPLWIDKVALVDPKTAKPTRVGFRKDDKGELRRFAKASGEWLDKKTDKGASK